DVKFGSGAFIKTKKEAVKLSKIMVEIGRRLNRNICAVVSSMNQPRGRAVGNAVEIMEVIDFLKGNMEPDLKEVTFALAQTAFIKTGKFKSKKECYKFIEDLISSGQALKKFKEIIKAQNGDESIVENYEKILNVNTKYEIKSPCNGYVKNIDALKAAKACKILGAGRDKKSDSIDYSAGVYFTKKYREYVKKDETIAILYTNKPETINEAASLILEAFEYSIFKPCAKSLVYKFV
ncbi:MAG: hypothetical protein LUG16_00350, partial [Candidatus Gastranaerophilales bacterium]|nr:hypothetical protein [Candidatus Gastranaerophilales bacterium]